MQNSLISELERQGVVLSDAERARVVAAAQDLLDSNIALRALQTGESAPDFTLTNTDGAQVALQDRLSQGPVVLSFYRGRWCGHCRAFLGELEGAADRFAERGAQLLVVSPQTRQESQLTQSGLGLSFPVLADRGNKVAASYGLAYSLPAGLRWAYERLGLDLPSYNGEESFELPVPATYVIAPDGRITFAHVDPDYTRRPDVEDVLAAV